MGKRLYTIHWWKTGPKSTRSKQRGALEPPSRVGSSKCFYGPALNSSSLPASKQDYCCMADLLYTVTKVLTDPKIQCCRTVMVCCGSGFPKQKNCTKSCLFNGQKQHFSPESWPLIFDFFTFLIKFYTGSGSQSGSAEAKSYGSFESGSRTLLRALVAS